MKGVQCYELFGGIALKIHTFSFSYWTAPIATSHATTTAANATTSGSATLLLLLLLLYPPLPILLLYY